MFFSTLGATLADALLPFSHAVVDVVASYLVYAAATSGAVPKLLFSFGSRGAWDGSRGAWDGKLFAIRSLAASPDDTIWCGDQRGCHIFSSDGNFIKHVASDELKRSCTGIAFDHKTGEAFCSDLDNHEVAICRLDGSFVDRLAFDKAKCLPRGIAVAGTGLLAVVERANCRVTVLSRAAVVSKEEVSVVRTIGSKGSGDGQFGDPNGLVMNASNELFVADLSNIQVFDFSSGRFLRKLGAIGGDPNAPWPGPGGHFYEVAGLALDAVGNLVVCDQGYHRVQIIRTDGTFLTMWGERDEAGTSDSPFGFEQPTPVCVDRLNRIFVADQHRIRVFGFA